MADELNVDGNIEVRPGPRGFSVVKAASVSGGASVQFTTDEPRVLNPVPLPRGKPGAAGAKGDPGAGSFRIDDTVGVRVFVWELYAPHEVMVSGDTGVRDVGGVKVRRTGNLVETTATDPSTLPAGFRPAMVGTKAGMFTTNDPWPESLPGEKVSDPVLPEGIEGYSAAVANGYPGTVEQWLNDRYRVLTDPRGAKAGQVYTRTPTGAGWADLPQIGPEPWRNITLDPTWKVVSHLGNSAATRTSNNRTEFYGFITYTGPEVEAGMWAAEGVRIGVMAPQDAPRFNIELVVVTYDGSNTRPVPGRLHVSDKGVMQLMCFSDNGVPQKMTVRAGVTQVGLTGLSYAQRNQ